MPVDLMPARDIGSMQSFTEQLQAHLTRLGADVAIDTAALGWRNELADNASEAGTAVPVRCYGNQVIVGPFPVAGQPARACSRCLARRWQAVKYAALRD